MYAKNVIGESYQICGIYLCKPEFEGVSEVISNILRDISVLEAEKDSFFGQTSVRLLGALCMTRPRLELLS